MIFRGFTWPVFGGNGTDGQAGLAGFTLPHTASGMFVPPTWQANQVYYVGKHGSDSNDGRTDATAFLTFSHAINQAKLQGLSSGYRWSIVCQDGGTYTETVTTDDWINIYAPNATIEGHLYLHDNSSAVVGEVAYSSSAPYPGMAVAKSGVGTACAKIGTIRCSGTANGISSYGTGIFVADIGTIIVEDGSGVGQSQIFNYAGSDLYLNVGEIALYGTGCKGVSSYDSLTFFCGCIDRIKQYAGSAARGIYTSVTKMALTVGEIDVDYIAYRVSGTGDLTLNIATITSGWREYLNGVLKLIYQGEVFTHQPNEFAGLGVKALPAPDDRFLLEDTADGYSKAYGTVGSLSGSGLTEEEAALAVFAYRG